MPLFPPSSWPRRRPRHRPRPGGVRGSGGQPPRPAPIEPAAAAARHPLPRRHARGRACARGIPGQNTTRAPAAAGAAPVPKLPERGSRGGRRATPPILMALAAVAKPTFPAATAAAAAAPPPPSRCPRRQRGPRQALLQDAGDRGGHAAPLSQMATGAGATPPCPITVAAGAAATPPHPSWRPRRGPRHAPHCDGGNGSGHPPLPDGGCSRGRCDTPTSLMVLAAGTTPPPHAANHAAAVAGATQNTKHASGAARAATPPRAPSTRPQLGPRQPPPQNQARSRRGARGTPRTTPGTRWRQPRPRHPRDTDCGRGRGHPPVRDGGRGNGRWATTPSQMAASMAAAPPLPP